MKNWLKLATAIVICEAAGLIGSVFTAPKIAAWYNGLERPTFAPPNWLFAPVWTILFLLIGISLYLVWQSDKKGKRRAQVVFYGQLALNVLWSAIFFGLENPYWAFIEIIALWISIVATIFAFERLSKTAAYLLIPYLLWVTFAAVLNYAIYRLNSLVMF